MDANAVYLSFTLTNYELTGSDFFSFNQNQRNILFLESLTILGQCCHHIEANEFVRFATKLTAQKTNTCSRSIIKRLEKGVKYVQNHKKNTRTTSLTSIANFLWTSKCLLDSFYVGKIGLKWVKSQKLDDLH